MSNKRRPPSIHYGVGDMGVTKGQSGPPKYPYYNFAKDEEFIVLEVRKQGHGLWAHMLRDHTETALPVSFTRKTHSATERPRSDLQVEEQMVEQPQLIEQECDEHWIQYRENRADQWSVMNRYRWQRWQGDLPPKLARAFVIHSDLEQGVQFHDPGTVISTKRVGNGYSALFRLDSGQTKRVPLSKLAPLNEDGTYTKYFGSSIPGRLDRAPVPSGVPPINWRAEEA